jgi:hypothetical protein
LITYLVKRAVSVLKGGKEDRSLSPMKFYDSQGKNAGKRRFTANTNKDWALSEVYLHCRKEVQVDGSGEKKQLIDDDDDGNFK